MSNKQVRDLVREAIEEANIFSKLGKGIGSLFSKKQTAEDVEDEQKAAEERASLEKVKKLAQKGEGMTTVTLGDNIVKNMSQELIGKLYDLDESGNWVNKYDWNKDEFGIKWLIDGEYDAEEMGISPQKYKDGTINGRHIIFVGHWKKGEFKGIMSRSKITGGYFDGGKFVGKRENFKISPTKFIEGGYVAEGALGLPNVSGKEVDNFSIIQVPVGHTVELIGNSGKKVSFLVTKGVDKESPDVHIKMLDTGKDIIFHWDVLRRKFNKSFIKLGETSSLEGLNEIKDGFRDINIFKKYEKKDIPEPIKSVKNKFIVNIEGLKANIYVTFPVKGHQERFEEIMKGVKEGDFISQLTLVKRKIRDGVIDGYGNFPTLRYLIPEKGTIAPTIKADSEEAKLMQYLSDLKNYVIDNFTKRDKSESEYLKGMYIDKLKKFLGLATTKVEKPVKKAPEGKRLRKPTLKESSVKDFISKVISENN